MNNIEQIITYIDKELNRLDHKLREETDEATENFLCGKVTALYELKIKLS